MMPSPCFTPYCSFQHAQTAGVATDITPEQSRRGVDETSLGWSVFERPLTSHRFFTLSTSSARIDFAAMKWTWFAVSLAVAGPLALAQPHRHAHRHAEKRSPGTEVVYELDGKVVDKDFVEKGLQDGSLVRVGDSVKANDAPASSPTPTPKIKAKYGASGGDDDGDDDKKSSSSSTTVIPSPSPSPAGGRREQAEAAVRRRRQEGRR